MSEHELIHGSLNPDTHYDYAAQTWIADGRVQPCAHPASTDCRCYGRDHAYEPHTCAAGCAS